MLGTDEWEFGDITTQRDDDSFVLTSGQRLGDGSAHGRHRRKLGNDIDLRIATIAQVEAENDREAARGTGGSRKSLLLLAAAVEAVDRADEIDLGVSWRLDLDSQTGCALAFAGINRAASWCGGK